MTKRDLAILGCKILGLFIFISNIPLLLTFVSFNIITFLQGNFSNSDIISSALQILMGIMVMACGTALWFQAKRIAQWIIPEDTPPASFAFHENFITAALVIIGIVLLIISIPILLQHFAQYLFASQNADAYNSRNLVRAYSQSFLGIVILASSANISRLFRFSPKSTFLPTEQRLTRHDFAYLGCRLLGIYLIVINAIALLSKLGTLATVFWQRDQSLSSFMMAGQIEAAFYFIIIIAIGIWLWLGADFFARKLAGKESSNVAADFNLTILPLLVSFVGLMLLVRAVPAFINDISLQCIKAYYIPTSDNVFGYNAIAAGAKVLLGLLLFFAPTAISNKLQNMGSASASTITSLKRWIKNPSGSNANG